VEMALAHFPRVIGLRNGALAFDLPAAQVTPGHLHQLYAQHLDELTQTAPPAPNAPVAAAPVPMQCR
ncbi:MAG: phosphonate ABC transporter, partial [Acidovorax sp.]